MKTEYCTLNCKNNIFSRKTLNFNTFVINLKYLKNVNKLTIINKVLIKVFTTFALNLKIKWQKRQTTQVSY